MVTKTQGYVLPRTALWLVGGLLIVSAALFVIGVSVERGSENHEVPVVSQNAAPAKPVDSDGGEGSSASGAGHVDAPAAAQTTSPQNESVLGIDLENPWLVGAAVVGSLVLMGALLCFGYRVLPIVVLFAIAAALFDVSEVLRQLQRNNTTVTLLAALVLLAHAAVGVASLWYLFKYRAVLSHPDTQVSSMTS